MITSYFDDSGTHGQAADIVLVAGIFGTEARMESLDRNWKRHLDAPLDGLKEPIKRFHAFECDNSIGDFLRWTRTETDYFRQQLRTVIIEAGVAAYGMACSRKDYDRIITGDMRLFWVRLKDFVSINALCDPCDGQRRIRSTVI